jgi:hypothetical protein
MYLKIGRYLMIECGFTSYLYTRQDWSRQKKKEKQHVTPSRHSHFTYLHIEVRMICIVLSSAFHSSGY